MDFNELLEESYRGFGTGQELNLDDLRLLYYGRQNVFVSFSDDGEHDFYTQSTELDRPKSILCYKVNDVVGKKVSTSEFYMNVFRPSIKGEWLQDIRRYTKEDLSKDINNLKKIVGLDSHEWILLTNPILKDIKIRHEFDRLWQIAHAIAYTKGGDNAEDIWGELMLRLGYSMVSDPEGTGILTIGRAPVNLFLDVERIEDLDVLPAQKRRRDPRRHMRDKIERQRYWMRNARNRVARRKDPIIFGRPKL